jgi:hypothetical protein
MTATCGFYLPTYVAEYVRDTLASVTAVKIGYPYGPDSAALELSPAARAVLEALPEDYDGHIDSKGHLWVDGFAYPIRPDLTDGEEDCIALGELAHRGPREVEDGSGPWICDHCDAEWRDA